MLVTLGAEWWAAPIEQPADRDTLATYDVDAQVLERRRKASDEYLSARADRVSRWAVADPTPHDLSRSRTTSGAASE